MVLVHPLCVQKILVITSYVLLVAILTIILPLCFSLCTAGEGGDGAGDPAIREGQGSEGGTTRPAHPDLPGTGSMSFCLTSHAYSQSEVYSCI